MQAPRWLQASLTSAFEGLGYAPTPKVADPWTVDKAVEQIPGGPPAEGSTSPLAFFHILERLKTTKREGWRRFGIDRCEDAPINII
jgi:putative hydrolases of HD superfamily